MELLAQLTQLASDPGALIAGAGVIAFWLRMEQRITRLETRIDGLPCKDKPKPCWPPQP